MGSSKILEPTGVSNYSFLVLVLLGLLELLKADMFRSPSATYI